MPHRVYFLNGPNANLYGLDKHGTYGNESFASIEARCQRHAAELGLSLDFRQSNHEGVLVDWIQAARLDADAVVAPDLSVHGIRGLWIGDASIMPQLPRGHPNAAVAMIGARAAAFAEATAEGRPAISFATHQTQGAAMKFRNMR